MPHGVAALIQSGGWRKPSPAFLFLHWQRGPGAGAEPVTTQHSPACLAWRYWPHLAWLLYWPHWTPWAFWFVFTVAVDLALTSSFFLRIGAGAPIIFLPRWVRNGIPDVAEFLAFPTLLLGFRTFHAVINGVLNPLDCAIARRRGSRLGQGDLRARRDNQCKHCR